MAHSQVPCPSFLLLSFPTSEVCSSSLCHPTSVVPVTAPRRALISQRKGLPGRNEHLIPSSTPLKAPVGLPASWEASPDLSSKTRLYSDMEGLYKGVVHGELQVQESANVARMGTPSISSHSGPLDPANQTPGEKYINHAVRG